MRNYRSSFETKTAHTAMKAQIERTYTHTGRGRAGKSGGGLSAGSGGWAAGGAE